jgi:hypothetical protein
MCNTEDTDVFGLNGGEGNDQLIARQPVDCSAVEQVDYIQDGVAMGLGFPSGVGVSNESRTIATKGEG